MRLLRSWLGLALALLYAIAFAVAFYKYQQADGQWPDAQALFMVALPYTFAMAKLAGSVDFSGESAASIVKAAAFCSALAYVAGALVGSVLGLGFRAIRRAFGRA